MKNNFFAIHTLGCKVNLFESNKVVNDLLENGYLQVNFNDFADIYIINTCSVTGISDSKSKNFIRRAKKRNPNAITVVMGCYSQLNSNDSKKLNVDIWIGNKYKNQIVELLDDFWKTKKPIKIIENLFKEKEFEDSNSLNFLNKTRAFVKIQDGCNFMCSYCIIPYARGKQRAKKLENVIKNIEELVSLNYKEIVLTGVNTAGYLDENGNNFEFLLKKLNKLKGDFRIRISSMEPFQITKEIINLVTKNKKRFCQQWHICLQSGSNEILKLMNRKYSSNDFLNLVNEIKMKSKNSTFTTDYIVGFPTESDKNHNESMELIKKINFLKIHIFPYSKRKNTYSSTLTQVKSDIKKKRIEDINKLEKEMTLKVLNQFIGKKLEVVFEDYSKSDNYQKGYSSEYIKVLYKTKKNLKGKKIYLTATSIIDDNLIAE